MLVLRFNEWVHLAGVSIFNEIKKSSEEFVIGQRVIAMSTDNGKTYLTF